MRFKHRGENDTVKHDIVFANKVYQFGIILTPVIGPFIGEFFSG
jgi:hypothetical protein